MLNEIQEKNDNNDEINFDSLNYDYNEDANFDKDRSQIFLNIFNQFLKKNTSRKEFFDISLEESKIIKQLDKNKKKRIKKKQKIFIDQENTKSYTFKAQQNKSNSKSFTDKFSQVKNLEQISESDFLMKHPQNFLEYEKEMHKSDIEANLNYSQDYTYYPGKAWGANFFLSLSLITC